MELIPNLTVRRSQRLKPEHRTVSDAILKEEIARRKWYHRMDLGSGVVTPGFAWEALWNNTRQVRSAVDYRGKSVLDLGSWDGMWAFEAEMIGATLVVATDCINYWQIPWHHGMNNLSLVREAIFSEVIPLWNVPPSKIRERLDNMLYSHPQLRKGFDVVQHLGLLYHLRDPMLSLAQSRSVLKDGGTLLLETAYHRSDDTCSARFNFGPGEFYDDFTTWWAPTLPCVREMLRMSLFDVDESSIVVLPDDGNPVSRVALRATARSPRNEVGEHYNLEPGTGHGFGEHLIGSLPANDMKAVDAYIEKRYRKAKPE